MKEKAPQAKFLHFREGQRFAFDATNDFTKAK